MILPTKKPKHRIAYVQLKNLPAIAYYDTDDYNKNTQRFSFSMGELLNKVFEFYGGMADPKLLSRYIAPAVSNYYLPIRLHNVRVVNPFPADFSNDDNTPIYIQYPGEVINIGFRLYPWGDTPKNNAVRATSANCWFYVAQLAGADIPASEEFYIYQDVLDLLNRIVSIATRLMRNVKDILPLYEAIPTKNEQYMDDTTISPNLTTTRTDTFNPVNTQATNTSYKGETVQKGTQGTTTRRANGVSAKQQADIIRNLPNLYSEAIQEIRSLLISPQTISDMVDWGVMPLDEIVDMEGEKIYV